MSLYYWMSHGYDETYPSIILEKSTVALEQGTVNSNKYFWGDVNLKDLAYTKTVKIRYTMFIMSFCENVELDWEPYMNLTIKRKITAPITPAKDSATIELSRSPILKPTFSIMPTAPNVEMAMAMTKGLNGVCVQKNSSSLFNSNSG